MGTGHRTIPLSGEIDEAGEIVRIPGVGVVPNVDTGVPHQPIDQPGGPVEGRGVLRGPIARSVPPAPVVVGLQAVERDLHLPEPVAGHEGADVVRPMGAVRDRRGVIGNPLGRAEVLERERCLFEERGR